MIKVPPLKERIEDIPLLCEHFIHQISEKEGVPVKKIEKAAVNKLQDYPWTGNIRELRNVIERLMILGVIPSLNKILNNLHRNKMKKLLFVTSLLMAFSMNAQKEIEPTIKEIYKTALTDGQSYSWLAHLSNQIGGRLSGSLNAQRAVEWGKEELDSLGLDKVWLQPVMVPKWIRGTFEYANIETSPVIQ